MVLVFSILQQWSNTGSTIKSISQFRYLSTAALGVCLVRPHCRSQQTIPDVKSLSTTPPSLCQNIKSLKSSLDLLLMVLLEAFVCYCTVRQFRNL